MNQTKHTAAPWQALPEEGDKPYIRIRGTVLGRRYKVANVLVPDYDNAHEREAEETRANARLIAAAPDLLTALIDARSMIVFIALCSVLGREPTEAEWVKLITLSKPDSDMGKLSAAIAKATQP